MGHLVGQEEHVRVLANIDRLAEEKMNGELEEMERKHQEELEKSRVNKEEEIARAVREIEWKHQELEAAYRKQIDRLEKDNRETKKKLRTN